TLGAGRILDTQDDLFLIPNRWVLFLSATIELGVMYLTVFGKRERIKLLGLLWLSSMFVLYRMAKWYANIPEACPCLGQLAEKLPLNPETVDLGLRLIVAYLFLGSSFSLLLISLQGR